MVRTFYTLAVLSLVSAGALFILCVKNGQREDSHVDGTTVLSAIERFKRSGGSSKKPNRNQSSPLVRQAQILAQYLNPPAPPRKRSSLAVSKTRNMVAQTPEIRPANTSPKFELHGISYRPSRPEDSMALVWQADTGRRWVRQGAQLGHITIAEINREGVLYSDGSGTQEMALNLSQAMTVLAQSRKDRPSKRESKEAAPIVARWAPVRRMRQIPRARVAARIGRKTQNADVETQ